MGNNQSVTARMAFNGGYLYVKTNQPFYYPGNRVLGKVYLRCEVPMQAKQLTLNIIGTEFAKFKFIRHANKKRVVKLAQLKKHLISFSGSCLTFNAPLAPGDYTIPFEIDLPADCPASVMW